MGQNRPKFRVHYSKKYTSSKKSTPPLVVAVVTNMSYVKALYGALKNNGDEKWDHLKKFNFY